MKNYYQILAVSPSADAEEIREAYRRLSKRVHPDVNWGGKIFEEMFKDVNEAYQVLSNPKTRSTYNQQFNHFFFASTRVAPPVATEVIAATYPSKNEFKKKVMVNTLACAFVLFAFVALNAIFFSDEAHTLAMGAAYAGETRKPKQQTANAVSAAVVQPAETIVTAKHVKPAVKKVHVAKQVDVLQAAIKPKTISSRKRWSEEDMQKVIALVNAEKIKSGSTSKCISIVHAGNSNVSNAFDLAFFLQQQNYTIAGRLTSSKATNGISVNCGASCIVVTIGSI